MDPQQVNERVVVSCYGICPLCLSALIATLACPKYPGLGYHRRHVTPKNKKKQKGMSEAEREEKQLNKQSADEQTASKDKSEQT